MDFYVTGSGVAAHTHSYTGSYVSVTKSTCHTQGTGYRRCATAGCAAISACTLPLDTDCHTFTTSSVSSYATSSSYGTKSSTCDHCTATVSARFAAGYCDFNGDDQVSVGDITLLLSYFSSPDGAVSIASGVDLNDDGKESVADITRLLYQLSIS